jgi:hypothetical protein
MPEETMMTAEEWSELREIEAQFAYHEQRRQAQMLDSLDDELDAVMGAYVAALDDPRSKAAALEQFDVTLIKIRELYCGSDFTWNMYLRHRVFSEMGLFEATGFWSDGSMD